MDLEFSITQYLDGSLNEIERDALEARLATDGSAREMLEDYRTLDVLLKAGGLPELKWDAIANQICASVATVESAAIEAPARSLRMPWVRMAVPLAMAASVLVAAGLAIRFVHFGSSAGSIARNTTLAPAVAVITGPQAETSTDPSESQISIGPAQAVAADSILPHYSDDVISRPARVTVASGINAAQDIPATSLDVQ